MRRYILGLSLVAFTAPIPSYLRQGCNLVCDPEKAPEFVEVYRAGERKPMTLSHEDALAFSQTAAQAFGVGEDRSVDFVKTKAKADLKAKD